jgi:REP element-mobilizing transposase RayT
MDTKIPEKLYIDRMIKRLQKYFARSQQYEFEIDMIEVMNDHMYGFLVMPQKYAPVRIVQIVKSMSAKIMIQECSAIKKRL